MKNGRWIRELNKAAAPYGYSVTKRTKAGHVKLSKPGCKPIYTSATPSDGRAMKNILATLRRFTRGS